MDYESAWCSLLVSARMHALTHMHTHTHTHTSHNA